MGEVQIMLKGVGIDNIVDIHDIEEAKSIVGKYARKTPLVQSMFLSRNVVGGDVYLKLENMQLTGSFKFRGANNKINHLSQKNWIEE
jgi:Threonine dehydratase